MNPGSLQKRISPIPTRAGKTLKRDRLLEKIIGCHSEKAVNDKIVKTSCGIRITASEAFSYSLMYFSVSFFLFSLSLSFPQISNHAPGWHFPPFLIPPSLRSQNEFTKPLWGIKIPLQTTLTLCLPLCFSSLQPDCSVFDRYCISRQSTRYLMGGKGKLN